VRATFATGMPFTTVTSSGWSLRTRRTRMPRGFARVGVVMWMSGLELRRIAWSAAAVWWLSTAPGPHALTAASQRPSAVSFGCPTAYTPGYTT
jgi:hypothetical protein